MTVLRRTPALPVLPAGYEAIHLGIADLLRTARIAAARNVNALMTASYWEIGRRIVLAEQKGRRRAGYGDQLIGRLSVDLAAPFGRGFSAQNLWQMRSFYMTWTLDAIYQTRSDNSAILQTVSGESRNFQPLPALSQVVDGTPIGLAAIATRFPLPWSAYVRLLSVGSEPARRFYETEALRNGWSVRQLDRQINSQFYERTALSRNKAAMLANGARPKPEDAVTPEAAIKDPYVLEFLDLKDEYSESELEAALIHRLEDFLLGNWRRPRACWRRAGRQAGGAARGRIAKLVPC